MRIMYIMLNRETTPILEHIRYRSNESRPHPQQHACRY